jgi:hypothetical protein
MMDSTNQCSVECKASNCMICNPNDTEKCNLCSTGYHMTSEMVCEVNNQTRESIQIYASFTIVLLALLTMWE